MYIYTSPYDGEFYAIYNLTDDDETGYLETEDLAPLFDCAQKENQYFDDLTWDGKIKWLFENHYINLIEVEIIFGKSKWETEDK